MALLSFPNPVDEVSARLVAGGAVVLSAAYVVTGWTPLVALLAYGFVARVLTGPTLSPLGQLVTRVVALQEPGKLGERRLRLQPRGEVKLDAVARG